MAALKILAGATAYRHIRENGLGAEDISAVFGASGAAKWLTIYGLDCVVFDRWLAASDHPVDLFGTSIGAFKLAAAAQRQPAAALAALATAYIYQDYEGKENAQQVVVETEKILDALLAGTGAEEILSNPRYNYHCASVRCRGMLASENLNLQKLAMAKAFLLSVRGRASHRKTLERTVFSSSAPVNDFRSGDGFITRQVALDADNIRPAILSTGSIPVVMPGVRDIPGAAPGTYRDGGLLDYHAVPSNICEVKQGLVLYPHFYTQLKEGWFDKFWPWRKASGLQLDSTVLIGPSEDFVASLPGGRIPDRQDFYRFKKDDGERVRRWTVAKTRSHELGEEFMELVRSGEIAGRVEPL